MSITYNAYIEPSHIYQDNGGVFGSNQSGQVAFDYFPDDAAVGDALYFGNNDSRFDDIQVYIGTAFAADDVTFVWEYYNGSAWTTLSVEDGTNGWTNLGQQTIAFMPPIDWETVDVNGGTYYWIRCRISAVSNPTEGGANSTQPAKVGDNTIIVMGYSDSSWCIHQDLLTASEANNWGVVSGQGFPKYRFNAFKGNNTTEYEQYFFNCYLEIGDSSTNTYFGDELKQISFVPSFLWWTGKPKIRVKANAHYRIGSIIDEAAKAVYKGCCLFFGYGNSGTEQFITDEGGTADFLASMLVVPAHKGFSIRGKVWSCIFVGEFSCASFHDSDVHDVSFLGVKCAIDAVDSPINDVAVAVKYNTTVLNGGGNYENLKILSDPQRLVQVVPWNEDTYLLDCILPDPVVCRWNGGSSGFPSVYEKYSFSLKVRNGADANVEIKDVFGNPVAGSPFTLDENGEMATALIIRKYDRDPEAPGTDTTETVITTYAPHTLTISKPGYETYEDTLTIDQEMDLEIALKLHRAKRYVYHRNN